MENRETDEGKHAVYFKQKNVRNFGTISTVQKKNLRSIINL